VDVRPLVVLALLLVVAGCGSDVDPDLYGRVAHITDCNTLRQEFATADAIHDQRLDRGDLDGAKWNTDYMEAIDKRMQDVGCYSN
jgi:hypothetical protein